MRYWPLENIVLEALDFEHRGGGQCEKGQGNGAVATPTDALEGIPLIGYYRCFVRKYGDIVAPSLNSSKKMPLVGMVKLPQHLKNSNKPWCRYLCWPFQTSH